MPLRNGFLLLAWTEFYTHNGSDWGPARIATMISDDSGRSWKEKRVLQADIGKMNVMDVNLLRLRSGKVLLIFARKNSEADCVPMVRVSTDDGRTFTPPKRIPVVPYPSYTALNNDRAIQLRSGRILLPLYYVKDIRVNQHILSRVYYSDDEGRTWQASRTIIDVERSSVGADEPGVVELPDNRVMLWVRTSTGHPYQSYSIDGGETWTTPEPMSVESPDSPQSIKRIPATGDLLMVWNNSPTQRLPLATAISKDGGHTWQHVKNLDDNPTHSYAYTSITFVHQRAYFTYYAGPLAGRHREHATFLSLKLKSVPVSWLYQ
ncbi:MAG: sialidase family protein [Terriglobia bacterium]